MGFIKKIWKNRISENPTGRIITKEDGTTEAVTVTRNEGIISQVGDGFEEENMNDLEGRIGDAFDEVNKNFIPNGGSDMTVGNMVQAIYDKTCGKLDLTATEIGTTSANITEDSIILISASYHGYDNSNISISYNNSELVDKIIANYEFQQRTDSKYMWLSHRLRVLKVKAGISINISMSGNNGNGGTCKIFKIL